MAGAADVQASSTTKGQRNRKRSAADAELPADELARRAKQRELRALALQLRAQGKDYRPPKKAKPASKTAAAQEQATKGPAAAKQDAASKRNRKAVRSKGAAEKKAWELDDSGSRPEQPPQVIICPIYWNKKADEKATVIAAADAVAAQLRAAGVDAGLDTTNALTPGQKYRFWEEKGVGVRIELGPRDAVARQACLALCKTPGEVADKSTLKVGAPLTSAVQRALGLQPSNKVVFSEDEPAALPSAATAPDNGQPATGSTGAKKKKAKAGREQAAADGATDGIPSSTTAVQQAPEGNTQSKRSCKKTLQLAGGDDLEGDFAGVEEIATEAAPARKKHGGKCKA